MSFHNTVKVFLCCRCIIHKRSHIELLKWILQRRVGISSAWLMLSGSEMTPIFCADSHNSSFRAYIRPYRGVTPCLVAAPRRWLPRTRIQLPKRQLLSQAETFGLIHLTCLYVDTDLFKALQVESNLRFRTLCFTSC